MSHFEEVCQYGTVHAQCRCMGPKTTRKVECPTPERCQQEVADARADD